MTSTFYFDLHYRTFLPSFCPCVFTSLHSDEHPCVFTNALSCPHIIAFFAHCPHSLTFSLCPFIIIASFCTDVFLFFHLCVFPSVFPFSPPLSHHRSVPLPLHPSVPLSPSSSIPLSFCPTIFPCLLPPFLPSLIFNYLVCIFISHVQRYNLQCFVQGLFEALCSFFFWSEFSTCDILHAFLHVSSDISCQLSKMAIQVHPQ